MRDEQIALNYEEDIKGIKVFKVNEAPWAFL